MTTFLPEASQELAEAVDDIEAMPEAYSPLDGPYRKYGVRPFPYALIYRIDGDGIVVVAVMHQKRKPNYWRGRPQC